MHANELDPDAMRLWSLALEFTEKLNVNRDMLANLRKQAEELKVCFSTSRVQIRRGRCLMVFGQKSAKGIGESYKVRRYNVDVTKGELSSRWLE
jgi:hypothetical protein